MGIDFEGDDNVIVQRLSTLYGITNRPPFFDLNSSPSRPLEPTKVPHCLNELAVLPTLHYKGLFITQ